MIENKVIFVKAQFKPVGKEVAVKVPTGEKKRGLFGGEKELTRKESRWQQTGWSDCEVDGERLSRDLAAAIARLNEEGFEVVTVLPVLSGNYRYKFQSQGVSSSKRVFSETEAVSGGASYGFGYGYSYTEGVSIIARRAASS